ncbi:MAG TPA: methyltransferase domain-containing protein [Terriglobales bacterium]|nr:methyltransferase domain-containing protein [Terriglobales bacterium]
MARHAEPQFDSVDFHNQLAAQWEGKYSKSRFARRLFMLKRAVTVTEVSGKKWLDAGCGTGMLSRLLAKLGARVYGIDAAPEMLQRAILLSAQQRESKNLSFLVADIERVPFPSPFFDGVLCSSVLEYVASPGDCLKEFARVLRPGGVLVISVPSSRSVLRFALRCTFMLTGITGHPWPSWLAYSRHQFTRKQMLSLLAESGFDDARVVSLGSGGPSYLGDIAQLDSLFMIVARKS